MRVWVWGWSISASCLSVFVFAGGVRGQPCQANAPPAGQCAPFVEVELDDECEWQLVPDQMAEQFFDVDGGVLACAADVETGFGFHVRGSRIACEDECGDGAECAIAVVPRDRRPPVIDVARPDGMAWALTDTWFRNWQFVADVCEISWLDACEAQPAILHGIIDVQSSDPNELITGGPGNFRGRGIGTDWYGFVLELDRNRGAVAREYVITYAAMDLSGNLATADCRFRVEDTPPPGPRDEGPSPMLGFDWADVGGESPVLADDLSLTISNPTDADRSFEVEFHWRGLVNRKAVTAHGFRTLKPGEAHTIEILAGAIPIQSLQGAAQVRAAVKVSMPGHPDRQTRLVTSREVFYRHVEQYERVLLFSHAVVLDKLDGWLAGPPSLASHGLANLGELDTIIMGRIRDPNGQMREIRANDAGFVSRAGPIVLGVELGTEIAVGRGDNWPPPGGAP